MSGTIQQRLITESLAFRSRRGTICRWHKSKKALDRELSEIKTNSISADEIKRAAKKLTAEAVRPDSLMAAPNIIGRALTTGQSLEDLEEWPEEDYGVRIPDVVAVANETLVMRNSVTSLLTPKKRAVS